MHYSERNVADCVCSPMIGSGIVRAPLVSTVHFLDVSSQYAIRFEHSKAVTHAPPSATVPTSAVLHAAGASLATVVKTTVFLSDMGDFTAMNEVYAKHFGEHRPARSTIAAAGLPRSVRVEIDCVARNR